MSDGQFSSKPLRSGRIQDVNRTAGEFSSEAILSTDATRVFLQSHAVQREVNALVDQATTDIGQRDCAPLHRRAPAATRELGRPIASATLVQEYLIGLIFLRFAGWVFMFFGTIFLVLTAVLLVTIAFGGANDRDQPPAYVAIFIAGFGLAIGAVGAWFGIFRGRVVTEMCWFCPRGMIWMTEGNFDWYTWEKIPDVYCDPQASRPAIGISFGRNLSWISFSDTFAARRLVEYIEKLASASCLPNVLQLFAEGKTIRFGDWRLSRRSIRNADAEIDWRDVLAVGIEYRIFFFKQRGHTLTASLDEIPFPSLFTVLALSMFGHQREQMA